VMDGVYGTSRDATAWKERERQKVRLAALLHDVGHSPFSHASEDLFPAKGLEGGGRAYLLFPEMEKGKKRYKHEEYSIALIEHELRDALEKDDFNRKNFNITASEVADLLSGRADAGPTLFWREILSNQLDADRMDYLLRDSHHLGVNYGKYDLQRLSSNVCAYGATEQEGSSRVSLGVLKGGVHAAESLIVARYSMFKQVYFHKTRIAYDIHLQAAMAELLPDGEYPPPNPDRLKEYLKWDDWHVLGLLADGQGGDHARRMLERRHFRMVYSTRDRLVLPKEKKSGLKLLRQEDKKLDAVKKALGNLLEKTKTSKNNWYKVEEFDVPVIDEEDRSNVQPLSFYSAMAELNSEDQYLLYVAPENVIEGKKRVTETLRKFEADLASKKNDPPKNKKSPRIRKAPKKVLPLQGSSSRIQPGSALNNAPSEKGERNAG